MRVRLKADGRLVEIMADGSERVLAAEVSAEEAESQADYARRIRGATGLTQTTSASMRRNSASPSTKMSAMLRPVHGSRRGATRVHA